MAPIDVLRKDVNLISKPIIIGNWKMNPIDLKEAEKLFKAILKNLPKIKKTEIVVCPPFLYLNSLKSASRRTKKITFGAQNAFAGNTGAFTGEVSMEMLARTGVKYVILGHSERRALGENNESINEKIKSAINSKLLPVVCVGEDIRDINHEYFNVVKTQVEECFKGIAKNLLSKIIIAYEPVWALSSTVGRRDASPEDAKEMVIFIRKILAGMFSQEASKSMRIIYGGSVNEKDAGNFLENGGVGGLLPGRASLDPLKFVEIIKIAERLGK